MIKKFVTLISIFLLTFSLFLPAQALAAENVSLFTPYTGVTAIPGDEIKYSIDVINNSSSIKSMSFAFENLPKGWETSITSGGRDIRELSVRGNKEEMINVNISVPLNADMGEYRFDFVAIDGNSKSKLPLLVVVTEQGSFKTDLTTDQANLQGTSDSKFNYTITIDNRTASEQNYSLSASVENGWGVYFQSGADKITSISIEPNQTKNVTVVVTPPQSVEAGTYEVLVKAATSDTSAQLKLEAVITGTYGLEISTPDGKLSTDLTAGDEKTIDLVVKNTGTAPLMDISIRANTPPNWESKFDMSNIQELKPGESKTIKATLKAPDKAIAGDYVTTFTASSAEVSSSATFRISVETSILWGAIAVLIILIVAGVLYYVIRKYGRR